MFRSILAGLVLLLLVLSVAPAPAPVAADTLVFQTDMYGTENIPAVTTVSYGFVRFFFNDARTAADYTVDVKGYNGAQVTGADIHRGARGVNGPAVKHLADGPFIVTGGRATFSEQDLRDMAAGLWYVSLKTVDHPEGALRGQIVLPAGFFPGTTVPAPNVPPVPPTLADPPQLPPAVIEAEPEPQSAPSNAAQAIASLPPAPQPAPAESLPAVPIFRPPNTGTGGLVR